MLVHAFNGNDYNVLNMERSQLLLSQFFSLHLFWPTYALLLITIFKLPRWWPLECYTVLHFSHINCRLSTVMASMLMPLSSAVWYSSMASARSPLVSMMAIVSPNSLYMIVGVPWVWNVEKTNHYFVHKNAPEHESVNLVNRAWRLHVS